MKKSWQRFCAIVRKETVQLLRDKNTLIIMISIPLIELFLLAYSAVFTMKHLSMVVYTQSFDSQSRELVDKFVNSEFFDVTAVVDNEEAVYSALDSGKAKAGLIIPKDFSAHVNRADGEVVLLLDGSDLFIMQTSSGAANAIVEQYGINLTVKQLKENTTTAGQVSGLTKMPITTSVQTLYNPNRSDLNFIIPGIAAIILQMFAISGIATTLVRERELGGAEQLLATPIRPIENILGKMIPYICLCLFELLLVQAFGTFWFGVDFKGNFIVYFLLSFLFTVASLGIGLLISSIATNQNQIQQITSLILLFSFLLSGLVFPRMTMPWWAKIISDSMPITYFLPIVRGFMVKGTGVAEVLPNIYALGIFCIVVMVLLPLIAKKRLD